MPMWNKILSWNNSTPQITNKPSALLNILPPPLVATTSHINPLLPKPLMATVHSTVATTKTKYIECPNFHDYIEVRQSKIHHKGVFAKKKIPKGMKIIEYIGEKITSDEADRREFENIKKGATYIYILDDDYCIDGEIGGNESKYVNHSCSPNCEDEIIDGKIWFISTKEIQPGEELFFDYEFPFDDPVKDKCLCGSKKCRGYIQSDVPN